MGRIDVDDAAPMAEAAGRFHYRLVAVAQVHPVGQKLVEPHLLAHADPPETALSAPGAGANHDLEGQCFDQHGAHGGDDQRV